MIERYVAVYRSMLRTRPKPGDDNAHTRRRAAPKAPPPPARRLDGLDAEQDAKGCNLER
jgi:hypothetical protein